jgi:hypothetical protein
MELENGKYIQHRIIERPWGTECQFTVDVGGWLVDDVIPIAPKMEEKELATLIDERVLARMALDLEEPVKPEKIYTEKEIVALLVSKELLSEGQMLEDLKTKAELATAEEVKP